MIPSCSSMKRWLYARRTASSWPRRAALLGSIAVSLALAGQSMTAGTRAALGMDVDTRTSTYESGVDQSLATTLTDRVLKSMGSVSGRSVELGGLFVLGVSLIGAGRALSRRRAGQPSVRQPARLPKRSDVVLRPHAVAPRPFHRAAG